MRVSLIVAFSYTCTSIIPVSALNELEDCCSGVGPPSTDFLGIARLPASFRSLLLSFPAAVGFFLNSVDIFAKAGGKASPTFSDAAITKFV